MTPPSPIPPTAKFSFQEWPLIAKKFIEHLPQRLTGEVEAQVNLLPPLSPASVESLASSLRLPIPPTLSAFLQHACGGLEFRYSWSPDESEADALASALGGEDSLWGGGEFCKASEFAGWLADCKQWAEDTWVAEYPEDFALWSQSFPILRMDNGDFLALDCQTPSDDPSVVYLCHDDESSIIAASFTSFLSAWARLGYVGPESWMISGFLNGDGYLDPETDKARELHKVLGDRR